MKKIKKKNQDKKRKKVQEVFKALLGILKHKDNLSPIKIILMTRKMKLNLNMRQ